MIFEHGLCLQLLFKTDYPIKLYSFSLGTLAPDSHTNTHTVRNVVWVSRTGSSNVIKLTFSTECETCEQPMKWGVNVSHSLHYIPRGLLSQIGNAQPKKEQKRRRRKKIECRKNGSMINVKRWKECAAKCTRHKDFHTVGVSALTCDCLWLVAIKYNGKERDKDDYDYEKTKMRKKWVWSRDAALN